MDPIKAIKELAEREPYRQFLKMRILEVGPGYALIEKEIAPDFLNIHGMTHGGLLFSIVDEAFELASNSHGTVAVALNMSITFFKATSAGDLVRAEAKEIHRTNRTATYQIQLTDQRGELIASCQALVYRKKDPLPNLVSSRREGSQ